MPFPITMATTACAAALLLPGAAAWASTSAPGSVSVTAVSCSSHMLKIPFTGKFTVAKRAGHAVTATVTLRSATNVKLKRVFFDYELDSPISHRRPTPTMSWRLDHRRWRALPLPFWTPASAKTNAFWESNDTLVGTIAAHSRHSLQMRITFHRRDHSGFYDGQIGFGAPACRNGHMLIGFGEINFAYQP
jgi:hypothetical protein